MQIDLRQTILGRINKAVVHTIHETEIKTCYRLALVGNQEVDYILLNLCYLGLDSNQNAVNLFRNPYCQRLLDTILIYLHRIGVLKTLEQTEGPVVVTERIINTTLSLCILGSVDITQDTILTLLKHLFELILMDIAHHVCFGLVSNPQTFGVVKTTGRIRTNHSLHGSL